MNREIKFRAFDDGKMLSMPISSNYGISRFFGILREDAIIMQYTGLKDINNVEIYEGDICQITLRRKYGHQFDNKKAIVGSVQFSKIFVKDNSLYEYEAFNIDGHSISYYEELEVIGNIYQNANLLQ
jgi:uncharacterized phage protein (TIGR01671 family)